MVRNRYYQQYDYTKCAWAKISYDTNKVIAYKQSNGKYKNYVVKNKTEKRIRNAKKK